MYAALGHDGPPTQYWRDNLLTGEPLARCPVRELLGVRERDPSAFAEFERYVAVYFPAYRDGHLLVAGGIADQPARYLAMMRTIADVADRADEKYLELTKESEK